MVRFINQYELESLRIKFFYPTLGDEAADRGDCDVGCPRGLAVGHLYLDGFLGVGKLAVPGSLFDEFLAVDKNERLGPIFSRRHAIDQLGEYNLHNIEEISRCNIKYQIRRSHRLSTASCKRNTQPITALGQIGQNRLNAFLLVVAQADLGAGDQRAL